MANVDEQKTVEGVTGQSTQVEFSSDQQQHIQSLIDDAYKRAYAKAQKSSSSASSTEEVAQLRSELGSLMEEKKSASLLRSIARHNVVDADEVASLIGSNVLLDESGALFIKDERGEPLRKSDGMPVTVDEYVSKWVSSRPHHLRGNSLSGTGFRGAKALSEARIKYDFTDPSIWKTMPREDFDKLIDEGVNVQGVSGQNYKFRSVRNPFTEARRRKFKSGGKN